MLLKTESKYTNTASTLIGHQVPDYCSPKGKETSWVTASIWPSVFREE